MIPYGLNEEQYEAILAKSPIFCHASAGAGKTRTLVAKIRYLLDSGVSPESIAAVTFTNKAANEMRSRLAKHYDVSKMQISTIHSMCVKIIRAFSKYTYLKVPFTIYDDSDQLSIVKTIVKSRDLPGNPYDFLAEINNSKTNDTIPQDENCLEIYHAYQNILQKNNACDFEDLLLLARNLLRDHQDCREHFINKWPHVLVDEVQDTSQIQYDLIILLYDPVKTKTLFVVGDENQSIYGFRNARPENIQNFIRDHKATVKHLTYNYRSASEIITHANHFQQFGKPMVPKSATPGRVSITEFDSREDEAEKIAQTVLKMINTGKDPKEIAIIYRVNARSLLFEQVFTRLRIPFKLVGDCPFYQRKCTKDLLAALKAANNPQDIESLARIINNPKRGFGDAKREQLLLQGRSYLESIADEMPVIKTFLGLLESLKGLNPSQALSEYLNRSGYLQTLTKESDSYMVEALRDMVTNYDSVEDLILASTFLEHDSKEGVNLLTAHASKGLEFDYIFVIGVEEGLWPHQNSEDPLEESRLYFVSLTRARKNLNVSYSRLRNYRGTPLECAPSSLFLRSYEKLFGKKFNFVPTNLHYPPTNRRYS